MKRLTLSRWVSQMSSPLARPVGNAKVSVVMREPWRASSVSDDDEIKSVQSNTGVLALPLIGKCCPLVLKRTPVANFANKKQLNVRTLRHDSSRVSPALPQDTNSVRLLSLKLSTQVILQSIPSKQTVPGHCIVSNVWLLEKWGCRANKSFCLINCWI